MTHNRRSFLQTSLGLAAAGLARAQGLLGCLALGDVLEENHKHAAAHLRILGGNLDAVSLPAFAPMLTFKARISVAIHLNQARACLRFGRLFGVHFPHVLFEELCLRVAAHLAVGVVDLQQSAGVAIGNRSRTVQLQPVDVETGTRAILATTRSTSAAPITSARSDTGSSLCAAPASTLTAPRNCR